MTTYRTAGGQQLVTRPAPISRLFHPQSWRYTPIPTAAYNAANPAGGTEIQAQRVAHGVALNNTDFGPPLYVVGPGAPTQAVGWWNSYLPDPQVATDPGTVAFMNRMSAVPIPAGFNPSSGTDGTAAIYQPSTDTLWEFHRARLNGPTIYNPMHPGDTTTTDATKNVPGDAWQASWGGRIDNVSQNLTTGFRIDGNPTANGANYYHGSSASGMSYTAGAITIREFQTGHIHKAIDLAIFNAAKGTTTTAGDGFCWPGFRADGTLPITAPSPFGGMVLREGQRVVMDRTVSTAGKHPMAVAIIKALQTYGAIIRDTAGSIAFFSENGSTHVQRGRRDPYIALLNGHARFEVLADIPLASLRALPVDYGKPA